MAVLERNGRWRNSVAIAVISIAVGRCTGVTAAEIPSPPREFRAAWIATVANIDWPSRPGLSTQKQQEELVALLDKAVELNLNAVILQIRPSADALYASRIEPWSEYLTGTMGKPPKPFYDPLKFAVDEAHQRGLQLHVWLNPYRVRHSDAKTEASPAHVSRAFPEIVRTYGSYLWFDPGEPAALERFIDVVTDVVKRYDIDGVHIDDYFYPYPVNDEQGKPVPFPDDESYARAKEAANAHGEAGAHGAAAGHEVNSESQGEENGHEEADDNAIEEAAAVALARDDWRRSNCDRLVEQMYKAVKKEKPWVLVGISPFGIWRPGYPEGIQGLDQYATLYADARKWLNEGWVDYFTPQLYWQIEGPQSYPKLLAWWHGENTKNRHLWPGNGAHSVRKSADVAPARNAWPAEELIEQIKLTRQEVPMPGNVHFSMKCLVDNRDGLTDKLKAGVYAEPALAPESAWLGEETPAKPVIAAKRNGDGVAIDLKSGDRQQPWLWVVRTRTGDAWSTEIVPGVVARKEIADQGDVAPEEVAVSAVTRLGREGPIATTKVE